MNRFMGMMPSKEVKLTKHYINKDGFHSTIQAGPKGWTVIWCDHSTTYEDIEDTTENNFENAMTELKRVDGEVIEVDNHEEERACLEEYEASAREEEREKCEVIEEMEDELSNMQTEKL